MNKKDLKRKAIELYNADNSYGEIATQLGIGKTTVYNWINGDSQVVEKNVPNAFKNEMNELTEYKEELQNEFENENDIRSLVILKKAEMEHQLQMERIELEREQMQYKQKMDTESLKTNRLTSELEEWRTNMENEQQNSERLISSMQEIKQNNELLSIQLKNISSKNQKTELDDDLQTDYNNQINNYLEIEGNEITLEVVENNLTEVEETLKQIKHWVKEINGKKSDYPELFTLKQMKNSLIEMINEFEDLGEDELVFTFNSEFEKELKEQFD
jgi:transposase